jgi:flagellar hook protein FlgE
MDTLGISLQGMNRAQGLLDKTATRIAQGTTQGAAQGTTQATPVDSVSLSDQMVSLMTARNDFGANTATAHVADDMTKATLDLLA